MHLWFMIYDHHALYDDDDSHDDDAEDDETTDSTLEAGLRAQWRRPEAFLPNLLPEV